MAFINLMFLPEQAGANIDNNHFAFTQVIFIHNYFTLMSILYHIISAFVGVLPPQIYILALFVGEEHTENVTISEQLV